MVAEDSRVPLGGCAVADAVGCVAGNAGVEI